MKNFRLTHHVDAPIYCKVRSFHHAKDVINFVLRNKETLRNYEIEWKTPVTGEYHQLLEVENWKKIYETPVFKLPTCFRAIK